MITQQVTCDNCKKVIPAMNGPAKFEERTYYTILVSFKKQTTAEYCADCCNSMTLMDHMQLRRRMNQES